MEKPSELRNWFGAIKDLLPGDHIHHVAPSSKEGSFDGKDAAIQAANTKRLKKQQKRKEQTNGQ